MKYILMNKNVEVLVATYDSNIKLFTKIIEIKNISYAPYGLEKIYKNNKDLTKLNHALNEWFKGRGIPSWRDRLDILLHRLNIDSEIELLDKCYGLSLTDQYFIKPYNSKIMYEDINFFEHDFPYSEFLEATFSNTNITFAKKSLMTPNNTTDGMLKKAWIIEDGVRYLIKGGYKNDIIEPFNEVLSSMISKRLGFNTVNYELDIYKDSVVSKCPCFINKDTELIKASNIIDNKGNYIDEYEEYIKILENNGIKDAREKIENMYILDFLIMNEDRHLNNFGVIRDSNTLKWLDVAPIYDNGESLKIIDYSDDEMIISNEGRFFYEIVPFDFIIKVVKNIKRIDLSLLDGVVEEYDDLLHKYQYITHMSDRRINLMCTLLNRQINKLKKLIG